MDNTSLIQYDELYVKYQCIAYPLRNSNIVGGYLHLKSSHWIKSMVNEDKFLKAYARSWEIISVEAM